MKLTNTQREDFVRDVIADIRRNMPTAPDERIRAIFEELDEEHMPASILTIKRNEPDNFRRYIDLKSVSSQIVEGDVARYKQTTYENNLHNLPLFTKPEHDERAMELSAEVAAYRSFDGVSYYDTFGVSWSAFVHRSDSIAEFLKDRSDLVAELIELQIKRYRWMNQMKTANVELTNKIKQCKTLADAKIMFPDLIDYLPEPPVKVVQLPVSPATDLMNALRGLGVPKEEPVAA